MRELSDKYRITEMAIYLKVSRQGYYNWLKKDNSIKEGKESLLKAKILKIFNETKKSYGAIRVSNSLKENGDSCGRVLAGRLMKELGLKPSAKKKFRETTDSEHDNPVAENILNRDFSAEKPDQKWVGDITYVWTREGWLYLAVIIDLFSRKVVGWSMNERISRKLVIDAWKMAVKSRKPAKGILFHSDRGSQYCSRDFIHEIGRIHTVQSMSRKGNCWDNAVAESFFHTLKVERLHNLVFLTRASAKNCIFEYIELFYNRKRQHSYLNYLSPDSFEKCYFYNELKNVG